MTIKIALAGNPNAGKSTLFNALTGSQQYVGNWPGVTVEKKTGIYKRNKNIEFIDLPGVYSLTPYSLEEVITKEYLFEEIPDVIINIIDATNVERNLYLSTQLMELNIPIVLVFNKMDLLDKRGEKINILEISNRFGCPVAEISAMKETGLEKAVEMASQEAKEKSGHSQNIRYSHTLEKAIEDIIGVSDNIKNEFHKRAYAIKCIEKDTETIDKIPLTQEELEKIEKIVGKLEDEFDDEGEGILAEERYNFIEEAIAGSVEDKKGRLSFSDKIDRIVTNRILSIPIFVAAMYFMYFIALKIVGENVTDWWNDVVITGAIDKVKGLLESANIAGWMVSLIGDGALAGVGAVIGFLPIIITIFIFIAVLEDIGYMSRIAFILDRVFRRFGLSGKSFIPILIGVGCSVPGIMATRTIENEKDRRMTIMVGSFMPCGAKTEIIALFAGAIFVGKWWFAPLCYFIGIGAVIISGIMLKKFKIFSGDTAPFVMELPEYQLPNFKNITKKIWDRTKSFLIKAGTVIFLLSIMMWFLQNISVTGEFHEFADNSTNSLLSAIGKAFAPIFEPLGFGNWVATVATIFGLVAKEVVVSTMGVVSGFGEFAAQDADAIQLARTLFTSVSALAFLVFNQLTIPCFAAIGAIREEMKSPKWTAFALAYQMTFSYLIAFMIYQFGRVLVLKESMNIMTIIAGGVFIVMVYLLIRPEKKTQEQIKGEALLNK